MNVQDFIKISTATLQQAGVESARLDAIILLEDALQRDRSYLLAHPEHEIPSLTEVELNTKIAQRTHHIPLAYIRGKVEFYGRTFGVTDHVLVPRPETETIITLLEQYVNHDIEENIIDVGTGSGAIAITAQLDLPSAHTVATDIDTKALAVAKGNAQRLGASVQFLQGDLLEPISNLVFDHAPIIVTNLPYVPESYEINQAAKHEPEHALFSGADGLDLYRKLWTQIANLPTPPLYVFTESLSSQHGQLIELAREAGFELLTSQDLIQVFKRT